MGADCPTPVQCSLLMARPGREHVTMTTLMQNFIGAENKQPQGNGENQIDHLLLLY